MCLDIKFNPWLYLLIVLILFLLFLFNSLLIRELKCLNVYLTISISTINDGSLTPSFNKHRLVVAGCCCFLWLYLINIFISNKKIGIKQQTSRYQKSHLFPIFLFLLFLPVVIKVRWLFGLEGWQQNVRWFPGFYLFIYSGVVYWFITTSELKNYAHFWSFFLFFLLLFPYNLHVNMLFGYVSWKYIISIYIIWSYENRSNFPRLGWKIIFIFHPKKKKEKFCLFFGCC